MENAFRKFVIQITRRTIHQTKLYIILMFAVTTLVSVVYMWQINGAASSARHAATAQLGALSVLIGPLFIPILASIIGSLPLVIFLSDKARGVYEYLMAYEFDLVQIYLAFIVASMIAVLMFVLPAVVVVLLSAHLMNIAVSSLLVEMILVYTIPYSVLVTVIVILMSLTWSALAQKRQFVNSPTGIAPLIGSAPTFVLLFISIFGSASGDIPVSNIITYSGILSVFIALLLVVMVFVSIKKMARERFLP